MICSSVSSPRWRSLYRFPSAVPSQIAIAGTVPGGQRGRGDECATSDCREVADRLGLSPESVLRRGADDLVSADPLPELLDCRALRAESRCLEGGCGGDHAPVADRRGRGPWKTYVRRSDVAAYLEAHTFTKDQVPA